MPGQPPDRRGIVTDLIYIWFWTGYDRGTPLAFPLGTGRVIKGWDQGLLDMCIGEKRVKTPTYRSTPYHTPTSLNTTLCGRLPQHALQH